MYPLPGRGTVIRGLASCPRPRFDPLLVDLLALVVIDPIKEDEPLQLQMNQDQLEHLHDIGEGLFDPNSAMVEGEVGEPITSVAQLMQSTLLLLYFSMYESDDYVIVEPSENKGGAAAQENPEREKRNVEPEDVGLDSGRVTTMFGDMGAAFEVPIGVVLEEMKVKKREKRAKLALEEA
ncbi:hypothetical protein AMTR_s00120p00093530 [Amborella trichopoda]|uniref:Uncharacterized protein n=1 Tax=Amborella trichopoda TaxID=13333 RepID=W1NR93_AMBTC|nr:hypothetical protein AMTR_s00120p00093530 [Amborella trichopoda]